MGKSLVEYAFKEFADLACEGDRYVVFKESWGFVGFEDGENDVLARSGDFAKLG